MCSTEVRSAFLARATEPSAAVEPGGAYGWATERDPDAVARVAGILLERTPHLGVQIPPWHRPSEGAA